MNQNNDSFTPEEKIKNEIELMKLKLQIEHGAVIHTAENTNLPPDIELAWFNHINNYEYLCKSAGYTSVYEFIGQPTYKKISEIPAQEIGVTLAQLEELMHKNGVALNYLENTYTPEIIYQFITEELFFEQICRYRGPEGDSIAMYNYEEFYPNHEYDLTNIAEEWMESIFGNKTWYPQWIGHTHEKAIVLNNHLLSDKEYSEKVVRFKENYPNFLFHEKKIISLEFDKSTWLATVKGAIHTNHENYLFTLHLHCDYLWLITHVEMELL